MTSKIRHISNGPRNTDGTDYRMTPAAETDFMVNRQQNNIVARSFFQTLSREGSALRHSLGANRSQDRASRHSLVPLVWRNKKFLPFTRG